MISRELSEWFMFWLTRTTFYSEKSEIGIYSSFYSWGVLNSLKLLSKDIVLKLWVLFFMVWFYFLNNLLRHWEVAYRWTLDSKFYIFLSKYLPVSRERSSISGDILLNSLTDMSKSEWAVRFLSCYLLRWNQFVFFGETFRKIPGVLFGWFNFLC